MPQDLPTWAELGRQSWVHRGIARPPWAEEPQAGQESVWDYPRPPRIVRDERRVRVELGGIVVGETHHALRLLETSHPPTFYFPRSDVRLEHLSRVRFSSWCEWKGQASWFDVVTPAAHVRRAAWAYEEPFDDASVLAGYVAFYAGLLEAYVGEERARPQAGGFYGGWITSDVVGPFKGEPGTDGW